MRAKLQVVSCVDNVDSINKIKCGENVKFMAVCGEEPFKEGGLSDDNTFAKWTPVANMEMIINNPALFGTLVPGTKYYVYFRKEEL